jgi:rubrerythrin
MSLPTKEIKKYFEQTGMRSTNGSIIWRCNECGHEMQTASCVYHLFYNHYTPIFEELEARRIINETTSKTTEGRNNKEEKKAVRPCEMCGTFYDNNKLSAHKRFG